MGGLAHVMTGPVFVPDDDLWDLPLEALGVYRCIVDYAFTIDLAHDYVIRLECPFVYTSAQGEEFHIDPGGDPVLTAPVLAVTRQQARGGRAHVDGRLELFFDDDSNLRIPPSEDYEAWTVSGPDGWLLVCTPGGEVAVFRPPSLQSPATGTAESD